MAKRYVAAKELIIDGRRIDAGTPLLTIEIDQVESDRIVNALNNGAAITREAFDKEVKRVAEVTAEQVTKIEAAK